MTIPVNQCIFCGGVPLSREHMYAKWLRRYLPKMVNRKANVHFVARDTQPNKPRPTPGRLHQRNDIYGVNFRVACEQCNNGWMSRLQERAKPFLIRLIDDDWSSLSEESQRAIAAWMTMYTIVAEFADPDTAAISPGERAHFMERREALPGWRVWIGRYSDVTGGFTHLAVQVASGDDFDSTPKPNTQSTTVLLKNLLIHTFSSPVATYLHDMPGFSLRHDLRQIHPFMAPNLLRPARVHNRGSYSDLSREWYKAQGLPFFTL